MRDVRVHLVVDRSGLELATYRLSAAAAFPWLAGSWSPRGAAGEVSVTWGRSHLPTPLCPGRWAFPESFLAAFRGKPAATRGSPLYSQSRLHLLTRDPLHFSMYISSEIPNTFAFHDIAPDSISWELCLSRTEEAASQHNCQTGFAHDSVGVTAKSKNKSNHGFCPN